MAVNRFDKPAEVQYISQYTPIPFQELYTIGKTYNDRVDSNLERLDSYMKDWKSFTSPIKKDIDTYYSIAMNPRIQQIVQNAVANPEILKSSSFRSDLQSAINSVDYGTLSGLRQSAENANQYLKQVAKMQAEGNYKRSWDTFDPNRYSTVTDGIFNLAAPTKFVTLQDMVNPYVSELEPTFYGNVDPITGATRPFTDWMAVTENEIRNTLSSRYRDLLQTPQGQNWYKDIAETVLLYNPDATAQDIDDAFMNAMVDASRQYIRSTPKVDSASMAIWRVNQARDLANIRAGRKKSGSDEEDTNKPVDFTDSAKLSSTERYNTGTESYIIDRMQDEVGPLLSRLNYYKANPNQSPFAQASMYETQQQVDQVYDRIRNSDTTPRAQFRYYLDKAAEGNNGNYNLKTLRDGTQSILQQYSYPITNSTLRNAFNTNIPGISPQAKPVESNFGVGYEMQRTDGLTLAPVEVARRAGVNINSGIGKKLNELQDLFNNNSFSYVLLENTNGILSLPSRSGNNRSTDNVQRANVSIRIPMDQLTTKGFTRQDIEDMGGRIHPQYSYEKQSSGDEHITRTTTITVPETVSFDCFSDVSQNMINQEYANLEQNRKRMSTAQAGELVPDVQWNAYDSFDIFNDLINYNDYGEE